ncbi:MAG TPA: YihY/virulence factor BrkB family protein [Candidatus Kapabacteria bacterium]
MEYKKIFSKAKEGLSLLGATYNEMLDDKVFKMTASLSYYTLFSIAPLLLIVIAIAGSIFGEEAARGEIVYQIEGLVGKSGAEVVQSLIKSAAFETSGLFATIISIVIILLGAMGVFIELKESLNIIWGVEPRPGKPILQLIKFRIGAFSMVLIMGFLLLVSLMLSTLIVILNTYMGNNFPVLLPAVEIMNIILSFAVTTLLFAMIFKFLPDVLLHWKYVWIGAIMTSLLFSGGKYLIGLYLGSSSFSSAFGAAGSLVVLLVWLNYSALILFFGAEFTQLYRKRYSDVPLTSKKDAIIIPKISELVKEEMEEDRKMKMQ